MIRGGDEVIIHQALQAVLGRESRGMEHWELSARESIRDLVARYNANGDSGRFDPMLALFAEDATMELPDQVCRGRGEIRAFLEGIARGTGRGHGARAAFIRHFTATHQIDLVDEASAVGRAYYQVLTDRGLDHWGRYVDEYRRVAGRWLIYSRKVTVDGAVPDSWASR
jgi:ketosteroid isomerase-like protein